MGGRQRVAPSPDSVRCCVSPCVSPPAPGWPTAPSGESLQAAVQGGESKRGPGSRRVKETRPQCPADVHTDEIQRRISVTLLARVTALGLCKMLTSGQVEQRVFRNSVYSFATSLRVK